MNLKLLFNLFILIALQYSPSIAKEKVTLFFDKESSTVNFAVNEIKAALNERRNITFDYGISAISKLNEKEHNLVFFNLGNKEQLKIIQNQEIERIDEIKQEGFIIHLSDKNDNIIWVIGYDEAGVMYGGLELAEQIKLFGFEGISEQVRIHIWKCVGQIQYSI